MPSGDRRFAILGGAASLIGIAGLLWVDARHGTLRDSLVDDSLLFWAVWFAGFVVVAFVNERHPLDMRVVWAGALLARLVFLMTDPTLSDDVYRYLWEGHLVTEGVSPYAFAIADPAGDALSIPARDLANNTGLGSPYLPFAHLLFGATAVVLPSEPWSMQLLMIGFDLLAIAGLARLLDWIGVPTNRALLYAWNPLVIVEIAHGAHLDAIIVALALWATVATLDRRRVAAPLLLAAALLTRPITAVLAPVLWWRWDWRQRGVFVVSAGLPVVVTGAISGFGLDGDGSGVFGSARVYAQSFRFNSAVYQRLEDFIGGRGLDDRGWNEPIALTRSIMTALIVVALAVVFWRARSIADDRRLVRFLVAPLAVYVVTTPVLHPWYLLLPLALVVTWSPAADEPKRRWAAIAPWATLATLAPLSYLTYRDPNAFAELAGVNATVWGATAVATACAVAVLSGWLEMPRRVQRSAPR